MITNINNTNHDHLKQFLNRDGKDISQLPSHWYLGLDNYCTTFKYLFSFSLSGRGWERRGGGGRGGHAREGKSLGGERWGETQEQTSPIFT